MIDPESLVGLAIFADLEPPQLKGVAQVLDEQSFRRDDRVLRQGLSGTAFYVILNGAASVRIDGQERAHLRPGEFFGEVSILLGEPPQADVVAASEELRCAVLAGPELKRLLVEHPPVMYRMLQAEARRLRHANEWMG